jgi:hypothetical protein
MDYIFKKTINKAKNIKQSIFYLIKPEIETSHSLKESRNKIYQ